MRKPSPSILVSTAALVVALGGTSYAAVQINGANLKNNSVTSAKIKNQSLTGKDVKNQSIKAKDLKPGVVPDVPVGTRWALVNAAGQIEAQSGGFTIVAAYPSLAPTATDPTGLRANGNVYINANEPLGNNGILASVALQNTVDQDGGGMAGQTAGGDANAEFSGEIAVSQCGTPVTGCAPAGAAVPNVLVVSPRLSNGQPTGVAGATDRKRFYVIVTGDSTDYTGPKLG